MNSLHFGPAAETILQAVPGLHTSICTLEKHQSTGWRVHSAVSIILFGMNENLRVDIDRPAFSVALRKGELYTVPANITYRLSALSEDARFLVVRAGAPWDLAKMDVDDAGRDIFLRSSSPRQPPIIEGKADKEFAKYRAGYTRLDVLASTDQLRLLILGLGEFRCVPWHAHDEIRDTFFCMHGPMRVETEDPDETHILHPGNTCQVEPGTPHFVSGIGGIPCTFLIVQGVGRYNYVPVERA